MIRIREHKQKSLLCLDVATVLVRAALPVGMTTTNLMFVIVDQAKEAAP